MDGCVVCKSHFKRLGKKSWQRRRSALLEPSDLFETCFGFLPSGFTCYDCLKKFTAFKSKKRKLLANEGTDKRNKKSESVSSDGDTAKYSVASALRYLRQSQYLLAFRCLLKCSVSIRNAMVKAIAELIRNEIGNCASARQDNRKTTVKSYSQPLNICNVECFNWNAAVAECYLKVPTITSFLDAALPSSKKIKRIGMKGPRARRREKSDQEAALERHAKMGTMLGIILYHANNRLYKFVPSIMSVELWRQGASGKAMSALHRMGISQVRTSALGHIDSLCREHGNTMSNWQSAISNVETCENGRRFFTLPPGCSYSFTWDNVQKLSVAKHQGTLHHNQMYEWAMMFATADRVPTLHLSPEVADVIKATKVRTSNFVLTREEVFTMKQTLLVYICRVIVDYLPAFKSLAMPKYQDHAYEAEMANKSVVINLGVVKEDPSSTAGVITILTNLQAKSPSAVKIPVNGDMASWEKMTHAKRAKSSGLTRESRLESLIPVPQEFHKEMILLQDIMKKFFSGKSARQRGSLYNIKEVFVHRNVKKEVSENFQHVEDLLKLVTDGFTIVMFMRLCGMGSVKDIPTRMPKQTEKQASFLKQRCSELLDFVWCLPEQSVFRKIQHCMNTNNDEFYPFCICHKEKGGAMVQCCSNDCTNEWFHKSCVKLKKIPLKDWYCSKQCRDSSSYIHCSCKEHTCEDDKMITCARADGCMRHMKYHMSCVGLKSKPSEDWYCSLACQEMPDDCGSDHILEANRKLLWHCLLYFCNKRMVRSGNGPGMILFWKLHMLNFFHGHPKYFAGGHGLLLAASEHSAPQVQHSVVWNRVANVKGGKNRNIGLDLLNELINNDFKETLRKSRGNYTDEHSMRCSQMGSEFGRCLDRMLRESLGDKDFDGSHHLEHFNPDVLKMAEFYKKDGLFDYKGDREYVGVDSDIEYALNDSQCVKFAAKIQKYSEIVDNFDFIRNETCKCTTSG